MNTTENIELPSELNKICRTCMSLSNQLYSIFETTDILGENIKLSSVLMSCASVQINSDEKMPLSICGDCINQLSNAYRFKRQCEKTDADLRKILKGSPSPFQLVMKHKDNNNSTSFPALDHYSENTSQELKLTDVPIASNLSDKIFSKNISVKSEFYCDICKDMFKCIHLHVFKCDKCSNIFDTLILLKDHQRLCNYLNENDVTNDVIIKEEKSIDFEDDTQTIKVEKIENTENQTLFNKQFKYNRRFFINWQDESVGSSSNDNFDSALLEIKDESLDLCENLNNIRNKNCHTCPVCQRTLKTRSSYYKHVIKHRKDKKFPCITCKAIFSSKDMLKEHMSTHKDFKLICDICNESYDGIRKLLKHFQRHVSSAVHLTLDKFQNCSNDEWPCNVCADKFTSITELDKHTDEHNIDNYGNFVCGICEQTYSDGTILKKHLSTHGIEPFACNICFLSFETCTGLQKHTIAHQSQISKTVFQCLLCKETFAKRVDLQIHIIIHASDEFACEQCGLSFSIEATFRDHMRSHSMPHLCQECGTQFRTLGNLRSHMRRHIPDRPYVCNICNKGFKARTVLKHHKLRHENIKPYVCTICGYRCVQSGDLQVHMRFHTGDKPYVCTFPGCSKRFTISSHRAEHVRSHTGERKHVCNVCKKAFTEGRILKIHMLIHGNERPFKCDFCEKTFKRKDHKKVHMKQHNMEKKV